MIKSLWGFVALLGTAALGFGIATYPAGPIAVQPDRSLYLKQLGDDDRVPPQIQEDYARRNRAIASQLWMAGGLGTLAAMIVAFRLEAQRAGRPGGRLAGSGPALPGVKPIPDREL